MKNLLFLLATMISLSCGSGLPEGWVKVRLSFQSASTPAGVFELLHQHFEQTPTAMVPCQVADFKVALIVPGKPELNVPGVQAPTIETSLYGGASPGGQVALSPATLGLVLPRENQARLRVFGVLPEDCVTRDSDNFLIGGTSAIVDIDTGVNIPIALVGSGLAFDARNSPASSGVKGGDLMELQLTKQSSLVSACPSVTQVVAVDKKTQIKIFDSNPVSPPTANPLNIGPLFKGRPLGYDIFLDCNGTGFRRCIVPNVGAADVQPIGLDLIHCPSVGALPQP